MTEKSIKFRDPVVERVVDKFISRSDVGFKKYGTTLHEERTKKMKGLYKYLNDVQEELMDAILYIQSCKEEIQEVSDKSSVEKIEDIEVDYEYLSPCSLHDLHDIDEDRMNVIGQNGNDGLHYEENN
jgi:hypothetical protein